jgi:hypothetical protein
VRQIRPLRPPFPARAQMRASTCEPRSPTRRSAGRWRRSRSREPRVGAVDKEACRASVLLALLLGAHDAPRSRAVVVERRGAIRAEDAEVFQAPSCGLASSRPGHTVHKTDPSTPPGRAAPSGGRARKSSPGPAPSRRVEVLVRDLPQHGVLAKNRVPSTMAHPQTSESLCPAPRCRYGGTRFVSPRPRSLSRTHVRMKLGRPKAGEGGFEPNPLDHPK